MVYPLSPAATRPGKPGRRAFLKATALANLEYEKVLHLAPTFHGDTLYAESEILEVTPSATRADRGVVYVETRALNQKGEAVLSLRRRVLIPRRPA